MDCSPMADIFALVFTSSPGSFSSNWAATVRTRGLGSSDVMSHRSAVASMNSHGVWSGAGTLGGEFSSFSAEILGCGNTEGSVTEMTGSGSYPAEVLIFGGEESGAEFSVSDAHPAEVLCGGREGSGTGLTANALSERTIASASFPTIVPVERTRLLNRPALLDSYFSWHVAFHLFLGFIFFLSLWTSLVPSRRLAIPMLILVFIPRLPNVFPGCSAVVLSVPLHLCPLIADMSSDVM